TGSFGNGWNWDVYYQYGLSQLHSVAKGMWVNDYLDLAYDAVLHPQTGAIVCASTLIDPGNGCKPYNPMGIGVNTPGAIAYVQGNGERMWRYQELTQN